MRAFSHVKDEMRDFLASRLYTSSAFEDKLSGFIYQE